MIDSNKNKQIELDWDNAPVKSVSCQIKRLWLDDNGIILCHDVMIDIPRPKQTPKSGQIWQYKGGSKYQIDSVGRMKLEPHTGWIDCVTFRKLEGGDVGAFFTRTLLDFLGKFVIVGDSE